MWNTVMPQLLNILASFVYWEDSWAEIFESMDTRLLIDSGAFTAWKQGKEIQLDDYCAFLKDLPVKPWRYFSLDVVGDAEKTMKNYLIMKDRGFDPVPVFTRGADIKDFYKYSESSDVVGVGGIAGTSKSLNFVEWLHQEIPSEIKVHWLGVTVPRMLVRHKPYSADSASFNNAGRFGVVDVYLGKGKWERGSRKEVINDSPSVEVRKALQSYSPMWKDLQREETWRTDNRIKDKNGKFVKGTMLPGVISAQSAIRFSQEIERKLGTLVFAAFATGHGAYRLRHAYCLENKIGTISEN